MDLCGKIGSENHLISQELLQLVAQLNILSTNNLEVLSLGELITQIEQFNVQNKEKTEQLSSTSNKLTADIEGAKEKVILPRFLHPSCRTTSFDLLPAIAGMKKVFIEDYLVGY